MAIQVASYYAIAMLRKELYILSKPSFQHLPQRTQMKGVFRFMILMEPNTLYKKRRTKLVKCQTHSVAWNQSFGALMLGTSISSIELNHM
jgi:hypothetical protein